MGFRYSGVAWDGQSWVAAPAIRQFGIQVTALRPGTYPKDGTVASKAHDLASPTSDHSPYPRTGIGYVNAIDFQETEDFVVEEVGELLRASKDRRIRIFIHNRRFFTSYATLSGAAWVWHPYQEENPHEDHGHLSVMRQYNTDSSEWPIGGTMALTAAEEKFVKEMYANVLAKGSNSSFVLQCIEDIREHNDANLNHGGFARRDEVTASLPKQETVTIVRP